jgi:hypothetical protein
VLKWLWVQSRTMSTHKLLKALPHIEDTRKLVPEWLGSQKEMHTVARTNNSSDLHESQEGSLSNFYTLNCFVAYKRHSTWVTTKPVPVHSKRYSGHFISL